MTTLATSELARLRDQKLSIDSAGWGWIGNVPLSPVLVSRWESAGLIEDYSVSTKTLTAKGERVLQEARAQ